MPENPSEEREEGAPVRSSPDARCTYFDFWWMVIPLCVAVTGFVLVLSLPSVEPQWNCDCVKGSFPTFAAFFSNNTYLCCAGLRCIDAYFTIPEAQWSTRPGAVEGFWCAFLLFGTSFATCCVPVFNYSLFWEGMDYGHRCVAWGFGVLWGACGAALMVLSHEIGAVSTTSCECVDASQLLPGCGAK